jgi:outer membrane lipoprotein SlyB
MAQANLQISATTDTGTTLSEKLNAWREAVYSMQRGATRPAYAIAGFQWLDEVSSTQWDWYFYDGTVDIKVAQIDPTTHTFILAADDFIIEDVVAKDIDGLRFRSANGTLVATFGAGNNTAVSFVGTITAAGFSGNLTGNVTGNVTGNLTGNVTGNVTGTASSTPLLQTTNYSIREEDGKLSFYHGTTKIASMDSVGDFTQVGNVTAYGAP